MADILVTRSSIPPIEEYVDEISDLWESHWLTNMGEKHRKLERELCWKFGTQHVSLFANGHLALENMLAAMGIHGKVITTPFTFASTTHAIVRSGLEPVFCDVSDDNLTLDPSKVEGMIDGSVCAILPVHVYGNLCDVDAFDDISKRYGIPVIYDAAHAFGVERDGKSAASFGYASMFSFHATKVFNTIEGGCVATDDKRLFDMMEKLKNFGITSSEEVGYVGGNAKMNEFCAAMGICNLRHLDEEIAKRRLVAERYWRQLDGVDGVRTFKPKAGIKHNYAYMPVAFDPAVLGTSRDDIFEALAVHGIGARKYFYPLTSDFACYEGLADSSDTPIAKWYSNNILTLPMYADLPLDAVDTICGIVKEAISQPAR